MHKPWNFSFTVGMLLACGAPQNPPQVQPSPAGDGPSPATPGTQPTALPPSPSPPKAAPENPSYPTSPGSVTSDNAARNPTKSGLMLARAEPVQGFPGSWGWIGFSGGSSGTGIGAGGAGGSIGATTAVGGLGAGGDFGTSRATGGTIGIGRTPLRAMRVGRSSG
ncbi:MAG TPA: hypothetical protein VKP30_10130 [Polyangiaceae bacterium]|nr:hypothetical protein [Polyangiaceae bacterium]